MLCCTAAIFILGLIRAGWFRLPGTGQPTEVGFAPVARRPAPGTQNATTPPPTRTDPMPVRSPGRAATALLLFAVGTVSYGLAVYALLFLGLATPGAGTTVTWIARDGTLAVIAVVAVGSAIRLPRPDHPVPPRHLLGVACAGLGTAWWLLGIADTHMLELLVIAGESGFWHVAFHATGGLLVLFGAVLSATPPARHATPQTQPQEMTRDGY